MKNPFRKNKRKILRVEFDELKERRIASHRVLQIGGQFYYRRDEVEDRMTSLIDMKIKKGELKAVENGR